MTTKSTSHAVATVAWEQRGLERDAVARLEATKSILRSTVGAVQREVVVVFPAGWFGSGNDGPDDLIDWVEGEVAKLVEGYKNRVAVTLGVDGQRTEHGTLDQLAFAITSNGIVGAGRKFFSASDERPNLAPSWRDGEGDQSRIVTLFGKRYYLAVCYDVFGIKKLGDANAGVDAVLVHVHGFAPKGEPGSGEGLFARHGFAGASQAWGVPVFGSVTFHNRPVPATWPSGVRWAGPPASTMTWSYSKNALSPSQVITVPCGAGKANVRVFLPWG